MQSNPEGWLKGRQTIYGELVFGVSFGAWPYRFLRGGWLVALAEASARAARWPLSAPLGRVVRLRTRGRSGHPRYCARLFELQRSEAAGVKGEPGALSWGL